MLSNCTAGRRHDRSGLSLLDLVVTMMIMGVLAAVAAPRMSHQLSEYRADAAAARLVADLTGVAGYARNRGASETVAFSTGTDSYSCSTLTDPDSPSDVYAVDLTAYPYFAAIDTIAVGGDAAVTFDGFGFPDQSGQVVISVGSASRTVTLDAATGTAQVGAPTP